MVYAFKEFMKVFQAHKHQESSFGDNSHVYTIHKFACIQLASNIDSFSGYSKALPIQVCKGKQSFLCMKYIIEYVSYFPWSCCSSSQRELTQKLVAN